MCWQSWKNIPPTETNLSATTFELSQVGKVDIVTARDESTHSSVQNWLKSKKISYKGLLKNKTPHGMKNLKVFPIDSIVSRYYLRFQVADKPGVLGRLALALGKNNISILSVHQKESHDPRSVPVIILTYEAKESDLRKALKIIDSSHDVSEKTVVFRVEK